MGRRSEKSNDVVIPEKPGNVGAKRESKNEMDRSAKKQKLAAAASTNHGMNSTTASIPGKKLPTATSLDENSTSISKEEDDINDDNEVGKSGQVHVDEGTCQPTRDCTAPVESGKTADEPHKMSKKRSKKNSKRFSKKKLKKEGAEANQSANKQDEASVDKNRGSKTVFVANLSSLISKDQIMEFFKDAGEIVDVRFTKEFRGFCYVEFADEAAVQKALQKNGEKLMDCDIVLSNEVGHKSSCNRGKLTIFVKGVDRSQPVEEIQKSLREYFGSCGEITYVLTPVKRSGISKGIAFLGFKDEDALSKALELNNTKLGDCILTVEEGGRRDGSDDGGKRDGFGGGDDFGSGRHDDFGGALDSSSGGNNGFGGCPGCDSIFCHGGSFGGGSGNGFNSGNGFRGESVFSGGNRGEFGSGREGRHGGVSHSGGGHGRGRSHSGGRSHNGRRALNGGQGRGGGRSHSGGRGHGVSRGRH